MHHKKYLAAAIVIWAINFSGTASASMNTNDCIFTLDEVVVKGLRYRYNVSKYGDKAENVPFSYTVVNEKDMEKRKVESLKGTLNYTAGVIGSITDEALFNNSTIRGFEVDHTSVNLNGMKMFGHNDRHTKFAPDMTTLYSPEMKGLESVTIVKGSSSVHHGSASPGGSIDLQLKRAELDNSNKTEIEVGTKNKKGLSFDVNRKLSGHSAFRLNGVHRRYDLPIRQSDTERLYIAPAYHWEKGNKTQIDIFAYWQKDTVHGSDLPLRERAGMYSEAPSHPIFKVPPDLFWGVPGVEGFQITNRYIGYQWEQKLKNSWAFHQNLAYTDTNARFKSTGIQYRPLKQIGQKYIPPHFARDFLDTTMHADAFSIDSYFYRDWENANHHNHLMIGFDSHRQSWDSYLKYANLPKWNLEDIFKGNTSPGTIDDKTNWLFDMRRSATSRENALYLQNVYEYGKVSWNVGMRHTKYTTSNEEAKVSSKANTWQTGISYDHGKGWHSFINHATSFTPNNDKYDENLHMVGPTTGVQNEMGIKYESPYRHLHASLALFHIDKRNYPIEILHPKHPYPFPVYTTVDQMISKGGELEIHGELNKNLEMTFGYAYTDTKYKGFQKGISSIYIGGVPKHSFSLWLDTETEEREHARWNGGIGLRFLGKRWTDKIEKNPLSPYSIKPVLLIDASLRYRTKDHTIRIDIKNMLDTHYYTAVRDNQGIPQGFVGDRRSVILTYSYEW